MSRRPYTSAQMRKLHQVLRARGLRHEDARALAGVASLTDLDATGMHRLIERLAGHGPQPRPRRPRLERGARVISFVSDAQLSYIGALCEQLAECDPDFRAGAFLATRCNIADYTTRSYSGAAAHEAIDQLVARLRRARRTAAAGDKNKEPRAAAPGEAADRRHHSREPASYPSGKEAAHAPQALRD